MVDLFGYSSAEQDHLLFAYHPPVLRLIGYPGNMRFDEEESVAAVKQITRLDAHGDLVGVQIDYDVAGKVAREEHFYVPYKKEDEVLGVVD